MNKKRRIILAGVLICYFIFGYYDSARSATLSPLMKELEWNYNVGSWLVLLYYLGYFIATLFGGMLSDRHPKKTCLAAAGCLLAAATAGYIGEDRLLFGAVFSFGLALGVFEVGGNGAIVEMYPPETRGRYLNIVAGMHSVGAILAPVICSVSELRSNWRAAFGVILPVIVASVLILSTGKMPETSYSPPSCMGRSTFVRALSDRMLQKYYLLAFLYLAAESTVISWMVSFLTDERQIHLGIASASLSVFFLMIGTGRFLSGTLLVKFPVYIVLRVGYPLGMAGIVLGVLQPALWWLLPVSGLFLSALLPSSLAAMSNECRQNSGAAMGVFFACGAAGGMAGSWLAGQLGNFWNIRIGILLAALFLLVGTAVVFFAVRTEQTENESERK